MERDRVRGKGHDAGIWDGDRRFRDGGVVTLNGVEGWEGDVKNKQTSRRVTRTESREIIGSEIMRDHAMPQSLHFIPRL